MHIRESNDMFRNYFVLKVLLALVPFETALVLFHFIIFFLRKMKNRITSK